MKEIPSPRFLPDFLGLASQITKFGFNCINTRQRGYLPEGIIFLVFFHDYLGPSSIIRKHDIILCRPSYLLKHITTIAMFQYPSIDARPHPVIACSMNSFRQTDNHLDITN